MLNRSIPFELLMKRCAVSLFLSAGAILVTAEEVSGVRCVCVRASPTAYKAHRWCFTHNGRQHEWGHVKSREGVSEKGVEKGVE